jgi:ATP-dependent Lon protease
MDMDALDQKLSRVFPGKVVRKDLLHQIKGGENVPSYVLEYLLGKYCASDNDDEIRVGIEAVKETLKNNYFRHDQANKAQSLVEQRGRHRFIDRVEVRFLASENKYWAAMDNFSFTRVHIPDDFFRRYERLLEGGIWAIVDVEFRVDEQNDKKGSPFHIVDLKPIQLARFDLEEFAAGRKEFSRDEWVDALLRSVGLERAGTKRDREVLCLQRDVAVLHPAVGRQSQHGQSLL